jgi:hypothetical protein
MEQVGEQSGQVTIKFLKIPETRALKRHLSTFSTFAPETVAGAVSIICTAFNRLVACRPLPKLN